MKFTDLMIYDLVSYQGRRFEVCAASWYDATLNGKDAKELIEIFDDDEIEPIQLTEEMLEKNGFKLDNYNSMWIYFDKGGLPIFTVLKKTGMVWIPVSYYGEGIVMQCVHELQHALRLCGLTELTELADYFKI